MSRASVGVRAIRPARAERSKGSAIHTPLLWWNNEDAGTPGRLATVRARMDGGDLWGPVGQGLAARHRQAGPLRLKATSHGVALLAALLLAACSSGGNGQAQAKAVKEAVPVTVAAVLSKAVPVQLGAIGSVQPYTTVTVKSQVDGEVARIHFTEGQERPEG